MSLCRGDCSCFTTYKPVLPFRDSSQVAYTAVRVSVPRRRVAVHIPLICLPRRTGQALEAQMTTPKFQFAVLEALFPECYYLVRMRTHNTAPAILASLKSKMLRAPTKSRPLAVSCLFRFPVNTSKGVYQNFLFCVEQVEAGELTAATMKLRNALDNEF